MNDYLKELKLTDFVVFDLETTGTDSYLDRIIEIAAVRYKNGKVVSKFVHLIDPETEISENISILTGITNDDVKGKPKIEDILPEFIRFTGDSPLIGHNINFDLSFLNVNLQAQDSILMLGSSSFYDTLLLSQIFFPVEVSNHRLSSLTEYFGFKSDNLHRAYNDCEATGYLFLKIIEKAVAANEGTVRKLVEVSGKSELIYIKEFFNNLGNYFLRTSFGRKIKDKPKPFPLTNILSRDSEPDDDEMYELSKEDLPEKIFSHGGAFEKNITTYEYREEQLVMAKKCSEVLKDDRILVCEAGTGVGKSFAYLVPSIVFSMLNKERIIVSTNTKNLQEQIFFKDLPVLHDLFRSSFKAVLLKGRNNYICKNRYERFLNHPEDNLSDDEYEKFMPLIYWGDRTVTGDIEENNGFKMAFSRFLWNKLRSDKGFCSGKKCPKYNSCYLQNVRKNAFKSDLVIINHSLLFSDMASENAVLGAYSHLVIDEAHNVENSATKYLGFEFNYYIMKNLLNRVNYNNRQGINIRIERMLTYLSTDKETVRLLNEQLLDKTKSTHDQTKKIFDLASDSVLSKYTGESKFVNIKNRYRDISEVLPFENENNSLKFLFEDLLSILRRLDTIFNMEAEKNHDMDDISAEIKSVLTQAEEAAESYGFFLNSKRDNFVFWYEVTASPGKENIYLFAAPLNVSELLKSDLYDNMKSIIFTSATLTIESRFKYMLKKLGLDEYGDDRIETLMLGTPFDLRSQLKIVAPSFIASPKNAVVYERDIAEVLKHLCEDHDNGTLVLFTSYYQMNNIFNSIKSHFVKKDRIVAVQNKDMSRTNLIKQFRSVRNSFLLGTDSFWEGIDVPGDALHTLIISKLPFAVPTEPVIQARTEELEKNGVDSFMGYSVPETVLKLKQGIGRLIRHRNDRGIILILDSRVVNTRYGRAFLNSLPVEPEIPRSYADLTRLLLN
jgi:predicted DnaQ family exonuclease/DinG family helicase